MWIQLARIRASVAVPTIIQRVTPWRRGRIPTCFRVFLFRPVPIRNSVTVRPILPRWLRVAKAGLNVGSNVFASAARQNSRMNQGHWMRALLLRAIAVATDRGTIHSARANLTVVPIARATAPYLAVAPTTELV